MFLASTALDTVVLIFPVCSYAASAAGVENVPDPMPACWKVSAKNKPTANTAAGTNNFLNITLPSFLIIFSLRLNLFLSVHHVKYFLLFFLLLESDYHEWTPSCSSANECELPTLTVGDHFPRYGG
jgi:hypothetical protein